MLSSLIIDIWIMLFYMGSTQPFTWSKFYSLFLTNDATEIQSNRESAQGDSQCLESRLWVTNAGLFPLVHVERLERGVMSISHISALHIPNQLRNIPRSQMTILALSLVINTIRSQANVQLDLSPLTDQQAS